MRRVGMVLAFALACWSAPLPASAQTQAANAVEVCVASAGASHAALEACKSAVAEPCIETPGGETTGGMAQCYGREAEAWTALLDAAATRAQSNTDRSDFFAHAQESWRAWRQAECRYQASLYEGGSLARVLSASCIADLTADRAIALIHAERTEER